VLDRRILRFTEAFVAAAFAAADCAGPGDRRSLVFGGRIVELVCADPVLGRRLLPALGHVTLTADRCDATIIAWTTEATGDAPPVFPWPDGQLGARGAVPGLSEGGFRSSAAHDRTSLVLWDEQRRLAMCWWRDRAAVPPWEDGAPFRTALHFVLQGRGRRLVHAAGIGRDDVGVLLAGRGGTGKSTTTEACLAAGLQSIGDDYVLLDVLGSRPVAHAVYASVKTTSVVGARGHDPRADGRRTLIVGRDLDGTLVRSLRIAAVLVPRIVDAERSRLSSISRAAALRAIAPATIMQVPREPRPDFGPMSDLVASVDCYELQLGRDHGVEAIDGLVPSRSAA
jgi:hypothetical protein